MPSVHPLFAQCGQSAWMSSGPYRCYPYLALSVFAVLAADAGVLAAVMLHPGVPGALGWLGLVALFAYGWLGCVALSVEVSSQGLGFDAPIGSGRVRFERIRSVRPAPGLPGAALVRIAGRGPLIIAVRPGWAPLAARLAGHPCAVAYDS